MKQSYDAATCYHCELPIPRDFNKSIEILGKSRDLCCEGCLAVASMIVDNGLEDYYKFRTEPGEKPEKISNLEAELVAYDQQQLQQDFLTYTTDGENSILLYAEQIRCSACAWLLERTLSKLVGVKSIQVNVSAQIVHLSWNPELVKLSDLLKQMHQLGYSATPYKQEETIEKQKSIQKGWLKRLGLAGLGMMQVMMFAVALYLGAFDGMASEYQWLIRHVSFLIATPILLYSGYPFYSSAFMALKNKQLNMDVPITLALFVAYIASLWALTTESGEVYFDSVTMFIFFLLIGRYIEFRVRQQVSERVYKGNSNKPSFAEKYDEQSGDYVATPVNAVKQNDRLLVRSGKQVVVDGELISESAELNLSMLNGEFLPTSLQQGQKVLAGSVNNHQPFIMKAEIGKEGSYWDKLLRLQEMALLDKPRAGLLADKVARYFVSAILLIASLVAAYWISVGSEDALWITLSVLVVSCPCALSLATPVAMTCGTLAYNQKNILIKGQDFLQASSDITDIVFDKTGTLTSGIVSIDSVDTFGQYDKEKVLSIIAALEHTSEHPIAKAFSGYYSNKVTADSVSFLPFKGVKGTVLGQDYYFGSEQGLASELLEELSKQNKAINDVLFLAKGRALVATVTLKDELRQDAKAVCDTLREEGYNLHLLSGDPSSQVEQVAKQLGFDHWKNQAQPKQKLSYIQSLQQQGKNVLMVGDGVNDAPVMSAANASIAMANAADITRTSADCYLLADQLSYIPFALEKAQSTQRIIKQNLAWAIGYNVTMIPLAAMGYIPPYVAAIGMSLSSIVVVINSLRLKR